MSTHDRPVELKEKRRGIERLGAPLLLALVLLVAAFLRLYRLDALPFGPYYDEAANVILTSEIASGAARPIFIPAYTGKEVLFFYVAAGLMRLWGASLWTLRLTAALLGIATVAATYWLACKLFTAQAGDAEGKDGARAIALLATVLIATSFWHVVISRYGLRALSQALLQALTLGFLVRGLRSHRLADWALAGLFCGGTAHTYLASRAFPLALAPFLIGSLVLERRRLRAHLRRVALFLLVALAVFAPLGGYFWQHPEAFGVRMGQLSVPRELLGQAVGKSVAMFAWRGDPSWRYGLPGQPIFPPPLAALFFLGLGISVARAFRAPQPLDRLVHAGLLLWLPIMLLPNYLGGTLAEMPNSLRAVGIIPVVYLFPAQGAWGLWRAAQRRWPLVRRTAVLLAATSLVLLAGGFWTYQRYFLAWGSASPPYFLNDNDLAAAVRTLNTLESGREMVFISAEHYRHPTAALLMRSYARAHWLVGTHVLALPPPGQEALYVFPRSSQPEKALRQLLERIPGVEKWEGRGPEDRLAYEIYRLPPSARVAITPEHALHARFEEQVELLGYDEAAANAGETLRVTLYWRVLEPADAGDYLLFGHLQDGQGFRWATSDAFDYPSSEWTPGQIVVQRREIAMPAFAPPGAYELAVGFDSGAEHRRLAVVSTGGRALGTTVTLGPLTVRPATAAVPTASLAIGRPFAARWDGLSLLGAREERIAVRQGESFALGLYWRADGPLPEGAASLQLRPAGGGEVVALGPMEPPGTNAPPARHDWPAGTTRLYRSQWPVPRELPPGEYALELLVGCSSCTTEPIALLPVTVEGVPRNTTVPAIGHPLQYRWEDKIELLGYDVDRVTLAPGEALQLTLYWRALAAMDTSYTVFTHLLDGENRVRAQQDNPPLNGTYPTNLWVAGEVVTDRYTLALDTDAPEGEYAVEVGWYVGATGQRLAVLAPDGTTVGDRLLLPERVTVAAR